ncbi:uncharacterized protein PODANS_1_10370 [Podospora anserina S mat+]|uniref:Podospora anserina S mat+ genomic DNA chromosome 1, supercontig 2 n=1 Tax=Podospora anserina (strain S / ATCC MYA-4624 / DSM 980 / FGSC 10383) TaxID=515849 RepID=B2AY99_PODAN|nr:uncharacterized protein PODANS_1_10370 [Podospora anserina S mat+]CAP69373.1 unnamed protein product [Podospora anserina S mat+]CDP23394.1 Putative SANT domain-containing protein 2 [Podospora anserina S mat+]
MAQKSGVKQQQQSEDQAQSAISTSSATPSSSSSAKDGAGATVANSNTNLGGPVSSTSTDHPPPPTMSNLPNSSRSSSSTASTTKSESPQPMEKSSASAAAKDAGEKASPYGTRSRNRTGAARPNYAEDRDIDMELFEHTNKKDTDSKKAPSSKQQHLEPPIPQEAGATSSSSQAPPAANAGQTAPRSGNASSRKPLPDESRQTTATTNGTKDSHPTPSSTTSTNTANKTNGNSTSNSHKGKKRKATSAAAPAADASTPSGSQTPSGTNGASTSLLAAAVHQRLAGTASRSMDGGSATPGAPGYGETNMLTFENCKSRPTKDGKMIADDGTVLQKEDHVYLVCEPPGEPYYIGRIMEFLHVKNDTSLPIDAIRVNWYYRPKDIGRKVQDTRLVFATMHSDISPLTSLRGKCQIRHKAEIKDLAAYKRAPDCFWYEKLYDRYIQKNYEVIPTKQVINVPEHVKKVLDEHWKYVLTEQGRGKELTSAVKTCKRCVTYCANNDSVDCAVCQHTYHMNCVKPPLLKKPSRGFAWSCAACSRAHERRLEGRNTPGLADGGRDGEDDELLDDEDEEMGGVDGVQTGRTSRTSPASDETRQPPTAEQIYHASLWPYRYFGMHCKVEDALDLDDRIFPRASTRLGLKHQAVVGPWPGRPVEYVKPLEFKKSGKGSNKLTKEQQALLEAERIEKEKRPKWVQDTPPGYIERGGDETVTTLWKEPAKVGKEMPDAAIDDYMDTARSMAVSLGVPKQSTNLQDVARDLLFKFDFNAEKALRTLPKVPKEDFKEPDLTPAEQKKFEEGVAKYGSELHLVMKHVKTLKPATVVRYYYTWKKTDRGKQVWGNFSGRKGKKDAKKAEAAANKLADDVADVHDDSAFDTEKAKEKKRGFLCKFCGTKNSRQWRRAPAAAVSAVTENGGRGANKDKKDQCIQALCRRCAELWRRYAIQWEDVEEVAKKVAQTGGRGWRKKVDEDLYKELLAAEEMANNIRYRTPDPAATASPGRSFSAQPTDKEPPRKKLKSIPDKDADQTASESGSVVNAPISKKKEKAVEKPPPPPPPVPEMPKPRTLPCAICLEMEPMGNQHLCCRECRLTVHRSCYGVLDNRPPGKWTCDMCANDKNPQVAIDYKCVLCPHEYTHHDFVEPPKISHKKKTEKERERDRMERENAQKAADFYRKKQEEMNRPVNPREPLKCTTDNNWVHVTCAVWTPEVKFGSAKALCPAEGIPTIPRAKFAEICKACKRDGGACVSCHQCRASVHVECAHQAGYALGFDITPVKGSRRDQHNIVSINGDAGTMSAVVYCKEHLPTKTAIYRMHDIVAENGTTALQLYVQNYKQADTALKGCAKKANQIAVTSKVSTSPSTPSHHVNRRASLINNSISHILNGDAPMEDAPSMQQNGKICLTCATDVSPKWHPINQEQERGLTNGYFGNLGSEAQKFVEQRSFQCHKCKKLGRQPNPHPQLKREPTPPPKPVRQASQAPPAVVPIGGPTEPRHPSINSYRTWSPPPMHSASGPPPVVQPPPQLQAPLPGPTAPQLIPPPVAVQSQAVQPPPLPPTIVPRGLPVQPPPPEYAPANRGYSDWPRASAHPNNMSPLLNHPRENHHRENHHRGPTPPPLSMPPLAPPPNHLRPPPIQTIGPPPGPPPHNGIMHSPYRNGVGLNGGGSSPPRRTSGPHQPPPVMNGYGHHVEHMRPPPPQHHMMEPQPQPNYLRQGGPHWGGHVHQSPPPLREPSLPPPNREPRASGASASPSLRNLLS